jgi:NAD(P)-dependent dehydrogenase (short-subunit alcohol dehydrogenase family)
MRDLKGKTAFITGGASGIGFGMAQAFIDAGMNVVIADIRDDHMDEATQFFQERQIRNFKCVKLDVTDRDAYARIAEEANAAFGKIHVVCNNAGMGLGGNIKDTSFDDWDWGIDVLFKGVINGVLTLLPYVLKHGEGGHIVNTSSSAAVLPGGGIYGACKSAILSLSEGMANDLAKDNIGVTALMPGLIKSNIHQSGRTRPDKYKKNTRALEREKRGETREVSPLWMEAKECGEIVVQAIRDNQLYVLTHVEYKPMAEARYAKILDAFPKKEPNPELWADWNRRIAAVDPNAPRRG